MDRLALIQWIRASLCEKDWDAFIEIYGIPSWIVIMPPNVPKEKESEYRQAALEIARGGSGAMPNGSDAKAGTRAEGKDVFRPRLDWLQEQLVLAGTGGLLSMLSMPTGMNSSQGDVHADAFAKVAKRSARAISEVLNKQLDGPILERNFPGVPHLASFWLASEEQMDPSAYVKDVGLLSTAGYQVDPEQITEKTGYKVTIKAAPEPVAPKVSGQQSEVRGSAGDPPAAPGVPPDAPPKVTNRAPGAVPTSQDVITAALAPMRAARLADLQPAINRLHGIMELEDPRLMENALRKLRADLNDPKSEIIQSAIRNPQSAKVLNDSMTAGLFNGMAQAEAAHPLSTPLTPSTAVHNRDDDGSQTRDSLGKWADENGGGLSERDNIKRGNKAMDRAIRQKADVQKAMHKKGLGQVDFKWGNPGDKDKDFEGGSGISHGLAKHGEAATRQIPETIAKGKVTVHPDDAEKRVVEHQGHTVILAKQKKASSWVITAFHPKK